MAQNAPSLEAWRKGYEALQRVKEFAPWTWMTETDIFGVRDPETDELGFVSVMGMLGEHYAVAVYLGAIGLYGFWGLQHSGPLGSPEQVLETPQLQASLEDRNMLQDEDRETIKQLGLKFRGRQAWPLFRSYRPGYVPWFLEADEARLLTAAMEQLLDVAPRLKADKSLLPSTRMARYLVRTPVRQGDALAWEDRIVTVPPPGPQRLDFDINTHHLKRLISLSHSGKRADFEIDFFMFPGPVRDEKGTRPYFPYVLLIVETRSGYVLGSELLRPVPSLEAMWSQIPGQVVKQLHNVGLAPGEIRVRSDLLLQLLQPLTRQLRFRIKKARALRSLDPAKNMLLERFG
jgi:hypothetical protein